MKTASDVPSVPPGSPTCDGSCPGRSRYAAGECAAYPTRAGLARLLYREWKAADPTTYRRCRVCLDAEKGGPR